MHNKLGIKVPKEETTDNSVKVLHVRKNAESYRIVVNNDKRK